MFDQCNFGNWGNALFSIGALHGASTSRNIRIHHNRIHQIYSPLVRVRRVDGFSFRENEILPGRDYPHRSSAPEECVSGEAVQNITFSKD